MMEQEQEGDGTNVIRSAAIWGGALWAGIAIAAIAATSAHAGTYQKNGSFSSKGLNGDSLYGVLFENTAKDDMRARRTSLTERYANGDYLNEADLLAVDRARKLRVMSPYQMAMAAAAKDAVSALNKMEKVNNAAKIPELSERKVRQSVWQANMVPVGLGRIVTVDKMMTITEFTRFIARLVKHEGYRVAYPRRLVPDPLIDLRKTKGRIVDILRVAGNQMGDRLDIVISPKKKGNNFGVIELIANGETSAEGYSLIK